MKRIFSTADAQCRERFGSWHDWTYRHLVASESVPDNPSDFSLCMDAAELGEFSLISIATGSVTCTHDRRHIESTSDELMLIRQTRGHVSLHHNGHDVTLAPGNIALIDPRLTYSCRYGPDSTILVVKCPRRDLVARIGNFGEFVGRCFPAEAGASGLLSEFLAILPGHVEQLDGVAVQATSSQILDLLSVSLLRASRGGTPRIGYSRAMLANQVRAAIDKALTDPGATAATIAAAAGISLRYANSILNEYNTSVTRLLQTRRLERCRQALVDPLCKQRSVSSIAYAWGFSDLTHFARRFRQAFGLAPREYRRLHVDKRSAGA
jgi:AraC family transcriptional regulator, positive regulator of tynA and feaB